MPERSYRPLTSPRRSELIAWLLTLILFPAVLRMAPQSTMLLRIAAWLFLATFLLSALAISLGNWMDRKTVLRIAKEGVGYQNELRNVFLPWESIRAVEVYGGPGGGKVHVLGEAAHFTFQTLSEVQWRGEVRQCNGFEEGQQILEQILQAAGLDMKRERQPNVYYYARS